MMLTNTDYMTILESLITKLSKQVAAGDKDAVIDKAWAMAFLAFLKQGHKLTDLSCFRNSKYYTGGDIGPAKTTTDVGLYQIAA